MALETGIFLSQAIWLWRVRHVRREAKKAGKTYDEYVAEHPSKMLTRSNTTETVVDLEAGHDNTVSTEALASPGKSAEKPTTHATVNEGEITTAEVVDENAINTTSVPMPEKVAQPSGRG